MVFCHYAKTKQNIELFTNFILDLTVRVYTFIGLQIILSFLMVNEFGTNIIYNTTLLNVILKRNIFLKKMYSFFFAKSKRDE